MPWGLEDVELGEDTLELGPGLGATTRVLARRPGRLSVLELQHSSVKRLRRDLGGEVDVTEGDATAMPYAGDRFTGVVCFTMLHHVPSTALQDKVFSEACRVLRPGGVFAGTDSLGGSLTFRLAHVGDTFVRIAPEGLPDRLRAAGFDEPRVTTTNASVRFAARKPA